MYFPVIDVHTVIRSNKCTENPKIQAKIANRYPVCRTMLLYFNFKASQMFLLRLPKLTVRDIFKNFFILKTIKAWKKVPFGQVSFHS